MEVTCKFCSHVWEYKGRGIFAKCPHCMRINNIRKFKKQEALREVLKPPEMVRQAGEDGIKEPESSMNIAAEPGTIGIQEVTATGEVPDLGMEQLQQPKQVITDIPEKTVSALVKFPFNLWASVSQISELSLNEGEEKSLTPMVKRVLDKHMGSWFAGYSDEIALAIIFGFIMMAKASIYMKYRKKKPEEKTPDQVVAEQPKPEWVK